MKMIIFLVFLHLLLMTAEGQDNNENFQFPNISNYKNINLLPKDCGRWSLDKTNNGEFPWLALLSHKLDSGKLISCGGSIINQNYILTAAHCVTTPGYNLSEVRVGAHNIKTEGSLIPDLSVEEVISHPDYDRKQNQNDIALVRVSSIDFSTENVQPICLPLEEFQISNTIELRITGWNPRDKNNSEIMVTRLPHVPLAECQKKFWEQSKVKVNQSQLCVGSSCLAQGGAPLHFVAPMYGKSRGIQQGIVSFGPVDCENVPVPDVYTRVAFFRDWILDNIKP